MPAVQDLLVQIQRPRPIIKSAHFVEQTRPLARPPARFSKGDHSIPRNEITPAIILRCGARVYKITKNLGGLVLSSDADAEVTPGLGTLGVALLLGHDGEARRTDERNRIAHQAATIG